MSDQTIGAVQFCGNCGIAQAVGTRFCPSCGTPVPVSSGAVPVPPESGFAEPWRTSASAADPFAAPSYPPGPYGSSYYPTAAKLGTNGMAIASMVLGILWVYWIGSILALVFGYVALSQIKSTRQSGRGMAIAGVVLGWVGVGTLVLLIIIGIASAQSSSGY